MRKITAGSIYYFIRVTEQNFLEMNHACAMIQIWKYPRNYANIYGTRHFEVTLGHSVS